MSKSTSSTSSKARAVTLARKQKRAVKYAPAGKFFVNGLSRDEYQKAWS